MRRWWKEWWQLNILALLAIACIIGAAYSQRVINKNRIKVYQECMADIHNVYACTHYSEQFDKYVAE